MPKWLLTFLNDDDLASKLIIYGVAAASVIGFVLAVASRLWMKYVLREKHFEPWRVAGAFFCLPLFAAPGFTVGTHVRPTPGVIHCDASQPSPAPGVPRLLHPIYEQVAMRGGGLAAHLEHD